MAQTRPTRRRAITLIAAACGTGLIGRPARSAPSLHRWRGAALGARAELQVYHQDPGEAARLIALALAEIERLERIFSLYRHGSAVDRLNAAGTLAAPPLDLVALLDRAGAWHRLTEGAFDVTVQPLWRLYRDHFAIGTEDGPSQARIDTARRRVGQHKISVAADRIEYRQSGMALTLNGIAQGYITDRVAELWRAEGLEQVLIDLGELRALGDHPAGRPWRVGLRGHAEAAPSLSLSGAALATSATGGLSFDPAGRFHHLLDPRTGRPTAGYRAVSVMARTATDADALSTALLVSLPRMPAVDRLARMGIQRVIATDATGRLQTLL